MSKFYKRYFEILENGVGMTTGTVLGPTQAHSANIGQSGDFYAPGDARNLFGSVDKKKKKVKSTWKAPKLIKKKNAILMPIIRRNFPVMESVEPQCPVCGEPKIGTCRCRGPYSLEDLKNGHGNSCKNDHRWSTQPDGTVLSFPSSK